MRKWRWYLSVAAVKQYMALAGLSGECELDNPDFVEAQAQLGELSLTATLAPTAKTRSGAEIYRGKITLRGKRQRVECTVAPTARHEGAMPQLIRVTLK